MMRLALLLPLALAGCSPDPNAAYEPVPEPTAESANRLMGEAERAASNAQTPSPQAPAPTNSSVETKQ